MPEILTESFCERCGTRYTFESARQRVRLKGVKVLSKGLKNFVLSDDTSIDEAMAAARAETEREVTTHQLDAFHQTFSFCMACRQYSCPNCWNTVEARCLSCAPRPVEEVATAPLIEVAVPGAVTAAGGNGSNGHAEVPHAAASLVAEPGAGGAAEPATEVTAVAAEPVAAAVAEPEQITAAEPTTAAEPEAEPVVAAEPKKDRDTAAIAATAALAALAAETSAKPGSPQDVSSQAAAQTSDLLRRFRPGQNIDAELDAYEREREASLAAASATSRVAPAPVAEPAPAVEPVSEVGPAPAVIPSAAESATAVPGSRRLPTPEVEDLVVQPTWQRVAPDAGPETPTIAPSPPPSASAPVPASPTWPARPEWPGSTSGGGLPFLGRPATPPDGLDGLWAASIREVVAPAPVTGKPANGVQPCVSCGLSLSATARFCRRCGASQTG